MSDFPIRRGEDSGCAWMPISDEHRLMMWSELVRGGYRIATNGTVYKPNGAPSRLYQFTEAAVSGYWLFTTRIINALDEPQHAHYSAEQEANDWSRRSLEGKEWMP